jgi:hypothetical protein
MGNILYIFPPLKRGAMLMATWLRHNPKNYYHYIPPDEEQEVKLIIRMQKSLITRINACWRQRPHQNRPPQQPASP